MFLFILSYIMITGDNIFGGDRMPVQMKNKCKPSKLFWRIIISAVGAALILIAVFLVQ